MSPVFVNRCTCCGRSFRRTEPDYRELRCRSSSTGMCNRCLKATGQVGDDEPLGNNRLFGAVVLKKDSTSLC